MKNKYFAPEFVAINIDVKSIVMASEILPDNEFVDVSDDTHLDIFED